MSSSLASSGHPHIDRRVLREAGLKASAYEYAVTLMRPEHRSKIENDDIKRKIEAIVRRSKSEKEEAEEEKTTCPISNQPIAATDLECPTTRDAIPMCIITGRHMLLDDWCFCPNSKYPATLSAYKRLISGECEGAVDPVIGNPIASGDLSLVSAEEATKYIKSTTASSRSLHLEQGRRGRGGGQRG